MTQYDPASSVPWPPPPLDRRHHWLARDAAASVPPPPRLLESVRRALRTRHYSQRTEEAYLLWIRRFILFHGKRHPLEMGHQEVTAFLSNLAVERRVSASTQNQALGAILFLYKHVLDRALPWLDEVVRAKRTAHLPAVLTRDEVRAVLSQLGGITCLVARLLYGSGLRLLECLRLRIQDVDFGRNEIVVRQGKGGRDRRAQREALAERKKTKPCKFQKFH